MYYMYILKSINTPNEIYTDSTLDLEKRLKSHNEGANNYASKFNPWKIVLCCGFPNKQKDEEFEQYLKTSSDIAFKRKKLL